jgi:hypothetical protein
MSGLYVLARFRLDPVLLVGVSCLIMGLGIVSKVLLKSLTQLQLLAISPGAVDYLLSSSSSLSLSLSLLFTVLLL